MSILLGVNFYLLAYNFLLFAFSLITSTTQNIKVTIIPLCSVKIVLLIKSKAPFFIITIYTMGAITETI